MVEVTVKSPDGTKKTAETKPVAAQQKKTFWDKIIQFEKLVNARNYQDAVGLLRDILNTLEVATASFGASVVDLSPLAEKQATIFCAAVTRLLSDPEYKVSDAQFIALAALKRTMAQSFELSGYRGTDHLIMAFGRRDENGRTTFNRQELAKLLLGLSINALSPQLVQILLKQPPDFAWPLCVGFLSEQIVWSGHGRSARSTLLAAKDQLSKASPKSQMVSNLGPAYMGCSYDESRHKHGIKDAMNSVTRRWLESVGVQDADLPDKRRAVKRRPTILIIAELYDSHHAMHRCYGPAIASLKARFKTVVMTPSGKMDEALTNMFDKVDPTPFKRTDPKPFIDKAISYRPDIVYFPSVGMRMVSIICSNVRMAPIQIFTPGHPATTRSSSMDYIALVDGYVGNPDLFSEKIMTWPSQPYFLMREDAVVVEPAIKKTSDHIDIAVPAWSRKVTPGFLRVCDEIKKRCRKQVKFHFFPNGAAALYQGFSRRVTSILPAIVHPRKNYNSYVETLNKCDLYLSTFPFGSTNGLVDGLRQGLPIVNLKGEEAHALIDSDILKDSIQPGWLTAANEEEYIQAAVRLIDDDEERIRISNHILSVNVDEFLFVPEGQQLDDFVDIFEDIYKNHEAIQGSPDKVWHHEARSQLGSIEEAG